MAPAPLAYRWAPIMCTCHGLLSEAWTDLGSAQDCVRPAQERPPLSPHPKCARDGGTDCAREIAGLLAILCTEFLQTGSRPPGVASWRRASVRNERGIARSCTQGAPRPRGSARHGGEAAALGDNAANYRCRRPVAAPIAHPMQDCPNAARSRGKLTQRPQPSA